ncbi:MAG: thioredoxin family protein [Terriglobales bacterium]
MRIGLVLLALGLLASAQQFPPLGRWETAVRTGKQAEVAAFYSVQPPPALIVSTGIISNVRREAAFWATWKKQGLTHLQITPMVNRALGPSLHEVGFEAGIYFTSHSGAHSFFLFVQQTWQKQPSGWKIISGGRTDLSRLQQPTSLRQPIYLKTANAHAQIAGALARARAAHKRVLLVFGGNWCYDCHVLDIAFHRSDLAPLLAANYEIVNVDVEEFNYNLDIVKHYGLTIMQGVPMLAVLSATGKVLASSDDGSFQAARSLGPADLIRFLAAWRPANAATPAGRRPNAAPARGGPTA